jgi:hypothetical protein
MHIDFYRFGQIEIDGVVYDKDVILLGDKVLSNWWRERGHSLSLDDLEAVLAENPERLILGRGAFGRMQIPEATRRALEERGIQVEAFDTGEAVSRYNESQPDERVVAAFHLTC